MINLSSEFWLGVATAVGCGTFVGLERQLRGKPAGIRTSILICLSTWFFVHLGREAAVDGGDPTRVVGQIVTGVGFLGAGVILIREGAVLGVTTAAVIWILAAVGASAGMGRYLESIAVSLVTVLILVGAEHLERAARFRRGLHDNPPRIDSVDH